MVFPAWDTCNNGNKNSQKIKPKSFPSSQQAFVFSIENIQNSRQRGQNKTHQSSTHAMEIKGNECGNYKQSEATH